MKRVLILVTLFLLLVPAASAVRSCYSNSECESIEFCEFQNCNEDEGICTRKPDQSSCDIPEFTITGPVCGCDGQTYQSDCHRQSLKISKNYKGECIEQISSYCYPGIYGCSGSLECIGLPGIGTRCAKPNPCSYFDCSRVSENSVCAVEEHFYKEVVCTGDCGSDADCTENEFCDHYPPDFGAGNCIEIPTTCSSTVSPICGSNGVTYDNDCFRKKNKVFKNYDGPCLKEISNVSCDIDDLYKDTCDFIGTCVGFPGIGRRCAFSGNFNYWPCPEGFEFVLYPMYPLMVTCTKDCLSNADCGSTDYVEYICLLHEQCNNGVTSEGCCEGVNGTCVERQIPCPEYYNSVCGCDGITYKNNCFLIEAGAVKKFDGECDWGVDITDITCDAQTPCPENLNLRCYSFPGLGPRCAKANPCSYYECPEGTECELTASYPGQVICSGICEGEDCEKPISYDVETGKVTIGERTHDVSIQRAPTTGGGFRGVITIDRISVSFSDNVIIENSKLYMETSVGKKQINIMPEQVISISETPNIESVKEIKLEEERGELVYLISGAKKVRLFFIIPVKEKVSVKVSAETGNIISTKKSWWSFLALDI